MYIDTDQSIECFTAMIKNQEEIASGIFRMRINAPVIAAIAKPGQFVNLYLKNQAKLLPRPISICEVDRNEGEITLVYRSNGGNTGTCELSALTGWDLVDVVGPLGNGFPYTRGKDPIVVGGGVGIPPLLELCRQIHDVFGLKPKCVLGYRDDNTYLADELRECANVFIATEDGSAGTKGNVMDAIRSYDLEGDVIYACGPMPMLKAVKEYALLKGVRAYISLEERMACGVGACLGCVHKMTGVHEHTKVRNARVCMDGPVFDAMEVEI